MSDLVQKLKMIHEWKVGNEAVAHIEALEVENAKLRRAIGQPYGPGFVVVSPLAHLSQEEQAAASKRYAAASLETKS